MTGFDVCFLICCAGIIAFRLRDGLRADRDVGPAGRLVNAKRSGMGAGSWLTLLGALLALVAGGHLDLLWQ